ncbi:MAG: AIR synthase family protein [Candidatus Caldatribacteriaceae bacterium]
MASYLGKLSPNDLERVVFPFQGSRRKEVIWGAGLGRDCGIVSLGRNLIAVTCDPITGTSGSLGFFAVQVVVNDLVCSGAEPFAILSSLVFPPGSSLKIIEETMRDIDSTCQKFNLTILGGHTEISSLVRKPLVHCVGLGKITQNDFPDVSKVTPGDAILITKGVGIEGTAILAWEKGTELERKFGKGLVERSRLFREKMSVVEEARIVLPFHPHCLHDVTEGGLLGALWEVCTGRGLGFEIEEEKIVVSPETRIITEYFGVDPLRLISSGTLLVFTPNPWEMVSVLEKNAIPAFVIGQVTDNPRKRIKRRDDTWIEIHECPQDELWRITTCS